MHHKHHVHYNKMEHMYSIYDTSVIPLAFKISVVQLCLSSSHKSWYGYFEDSVCKSVSGYALGFIGFALFENCDVYFYSY